VGRTEEEKEQKYQFDKLEWDVYKLDRFLQVSSAFLSTPSFPSFTPQFIMPQWLGGGGAGGIGFLAIFLGQVAQEKNVLAEWGVRCS
jgi:hypothetical protein